MIESIQKKDTNGWKYTEIESAIFLIIDLMSIYVKMTQMWEFSAFHSKLNSFWLLVPAKQDIC